MELSEDIEAKELHQELNDAVLEPKAFKKFKVMADKLLEKVNGRITSERDSIRQKVDASAERAQATMDKFIEGTNSDLERFKKRYEAMYTDLVRRILLKMEGRVFACEIFEQATLDLLVKKIYRLENGFSRYSELDEDAYHKYIEECAKDHEELMQKTATDFSNRQKDERDAAIQEEEASAQAQDTGGAEDEGSDNSNTEDVGTTDSPDGGQAEPSSEEK